MRVCLSTYRALYVRPHRDIRIYVCAYTYLCPYTYVYKGAGAHGMCVLCVRIDTYARRTACVCNHLLAYPELTHVTALTKIEPCV